MKIKHLIYSLLIISIAGFIVYRISANKAKNDESKDRGKNKKISVSGIIVKPQSFNNSISLSGSIEANEQVEIRSEVSGIVEGIYLK